MYIMKSVIVRKIRSLLLKSIHRIENSGNDDFQKNGELTFISNMFSYFFKNKIKKIVVFDVGANVGEYSGFLLEKQKKYQVEMDLHLFEPTESCFLELQKNCYKKNVFLNNFGISDKDTISKIFYNKEKSGLASLHQRNLDYYHLEMNKSENVALKRVDKYILENSIQHINFVKIDIEGHELNAFRGFGEYLDAGFIDFIQFEYGDANIGSKTTLNELYMFLESKGFILAKVFPNGIEVRKYNPFIMENFTQANYIAVSKNIYERSV